MHPRYFQKPLRDYFRRRRFKGFLSAYQSCRTILDIGGEQDLWEMIGRREGVIILNTFVPERAELVPHLVGSGLALPFADQSIGLALANSVIEHAGAEEQQFQFAREMLRVGKRIYCQTPSRLFLVDPHLAMPFLHWLPRRWLTPWFLRYFTLNGWLYGRKVEYGVTWISRKKLQKMFPGCRITTERFLLLPKSFTVTN